MSGLLFFFCFGRKEKMDLKALGFKIIEKIKKDPFGYQAYEDYYGIMKTLLLKEIELYTEFRRERE